MLRFLAALLWWGALASAAAGFVVLCSIVYYGIRIRLELHREDATVRHAMASFEADIDRLLAHD